MYFLGEIGASLGAQNYTIPNLNSLKENIRGYSSTVEHLTFNQMVVGSNPAALNISKHNKWLLKNPHKTLKNTFYEWFLLYVKFIKLGMSLNYSFLHNKTLFWSFLKLQTNSSLGWTNLGSKFKLKKLDIPSMPKRSYRLASLHTNPVTHSPIFTNSTFLFRAFLLNWQLTRPKSEYSYTTHHDFRLLFLQADVQSLDYALVGAKRYFLRWVDSYNLLFNLFYSDPSVQLLSNKTFIEESLTFNWQYSLKNYKLFKYTQPWLLFKDATHGAYIHKVVRLILQQNLDFLIVTDIHNHNKLLPYLKRYSLYIIGLIPINRSPWRVSYPIPVFADSSLSQFYFLRWVFFIKGKAQTHKYSDSLTFWHKLQGPFMK